MTTEVPRTDTGWPAWNAPWSEQAAYEQWAADRLAETGKESQSFEDYSQKALDVGYGDPGQYWWQGLWK